MKSKRLFLLLPAAAIAGVVFAQGPLTPPGAPGPVMKTLDQIEPRTNLQATPAPPGVDNTNADYHFIITQPGSYYLSANLGVTKLVGIQINAEGVTLDLNGFEISRAAGTGGAGIEIPPTSHRTSIRNGSIKGFIYGIRSATVGPGYARACAFRDLAASGSTFAGIYAGDGAVLESCRVHDNTGSIGIFANDGSLLINCDAANNSATYAIWVADGCTLVNCTASYNTGTYGIFAESGSSLTNCSAYRNESGAFTSAGIRTLLGCRIIHCTAYENRSSGFSGSTTGMGFEVGSNNTIEGCTASSNEGDGIKIESSTVVRDNTCHGNGNAGIGAGIHSTGAYNRIEGNNVSENDRGIDVDGRYSLIIKNSAAGNTTAYEIAASNHYGRIVPATGSGTAAMSGDSANSTLPYTTDTMDAWWNFTY